MIFRDALLQVAPFGNDQKRDLEKGLECCREAKYLGADLAVFPELWNTGATRYPIDTAAGQSWAASAIDRQSYFFLRFAELVRELSLNIALTYLEAHAPKPRNSVSVISSAGKTVLNYSKVFICDFGQAELLKPSPNAANIGCDVNCCPGRSFDVCTLSGAESEVCVGTMICADREFQDPPLS